MLWHEVRLGDFSCIYLLLIVFEVFAQLLTETNQRSEVFNKHCLFLDIDNPETRRVTMETNTDSV